MASEGNSVAALVHDGVRRTLFQMAFPMLAGTFAMNAYALTGENPGTGKPGDRHLLFGD